MTAEVEYVLLVDLVSGIPILGAGVYSVLPVRHGRVSTVNFSGSPDSTSLQDLLSLAKRKVRGCGKAGCNDNPIDSGNGER
jgi:hypothetical protein